MMEMRRASRSGLFLLELMLVILFFALTSAICANLFVQAHLVSRQSSALTGAVREVQSVAERYKAAGGDLTQLSAEANQSMEQGHLNVSYNQNWEESDPENGIYTITVLPGGQSFSLPDGSVVSAKKSPYNGCETALFVAWNEKGEIFRISAGVFSEKESS